MSATSSTSSSPSASSTVGVGTAQSSHGISIVAFISALTSSVIIFSIQIFAFILLKEKLARIFKPKTYLVPEKERTEPPPSTPWGWLFAIFRFRDREVINKCGLDAYFFLRYLQTLLVIFIPLAVVILPALLPINYHGGRGPTYALEFPNRAAGDSSTANVTGLDMLAWGNVRSTKTHRYWAHLILAILVVIWVCGVFFSELRVFVRVRQDYLTSAEHRLRASATTILVSAIPRKWLTKEALGGLYDVFPGGIRNIWINRNYDQLLDKIHLRDDVFTKLEAAETELIVKAKKAQRKQVEKEEKAAAKKVHVKGMTKEEKGQKRQRENQEGERRARSGGVSTGDPHQVPHNVDDAMNEAEEQSKTQDTAAKGTFKIPIIGGGLAIVGGGIGKGFEAAGKVGETAFGGVRAVGRDINDQLETTNGFANLDARSIADNESYDEYGRYRGDARNAAEPYGTGADNRDMRMESQHEEVTPSSSRDLRDSQKNTRQQESTVRQPHDDYGIDGTNDKRGRLGDWWKFWKPPAGGFASPVPTGYKDGEVHPLPQTDGGRSSTSKHSGNAALEGKQGIWAKIKSSVPFLHEEEVEPLDYPLACNPDYKEDATGAVWQKYLKEKDRPTHRIPRFSWTPGWLPGIPLISPKVDSIYWCRGELARLDLEIEMDQKEPERFPIMNSAFIQFNHQVAAHMACQSVTYHVPKQMAPRTVEISPSDVLWDNMSIKWWENWLRTAVVFLVVSGMVILWTFPVAWTASLAQITTLANNYTWLHWLNKIPERVLQSLAGILPPLVLSILLVLVPLILSYLAFVQGAQTGMQKQRSVQNYYFAFLFVQVFLVVSISGGALATLSSATNITSIPETLATQLPKATNYFFSYMILQALSTSSGTLLQLTTLILWFVLPKILDTTPRQKWSRNTTLPQVKWGTFFPVYTNFACIALIYCVVAPLIIVFAIITFSLLWMANRYNMLYVSRFKTDTGGLLFPRAINQTFTGLYFMEVLLVGLFFLVRDENDNAACVPQAIIMIVVAALTVLYQILLNLSFGPLLNYLPITFEDEAVLRDEAFERAQSRRLGLDEEEDDAPTPPPKDGTSIHDSGNIEMQNLNTGNKFANPKYHPVNIAQGAHSWVTKPARDLRERKAARASRDEPNVQQGDTSALPDVVSNRKHRRPDIEEQQKIADALYGGINDEIEDLTPDERDVLVKQAFQHYALRARRPTVWIPRDDIGVSDDEVRRTREFAGANIWISNVGAALDGKFSVVYGRNPPDFSETDLINL